MCSERQQPLVRLPRAHVSGPKFLLEPIVPLQNPLRLGGLLIRRRRSLSGEYLKVVSTRPDNWSVE